MSFAATLQRDAGLAPSDVPQYRVLSSMAHDLRQPLSNIEAIVYHLATILPQNDREVQAHLERIRKLVQETDEILSNSLREAAPAAPLTQSAPPAGA